MSATCHRLNNNDDNVVRFVDVCYVYTVHAHTRVLSKLSFIAAIRTNLPGKNGKELTGVIYPLPCKHTAREKFPLSISSAAP